jgi:polyketide cyclase/dehydrase/lipid transport protein
VATDVRVEVMIGRPRTEVAAFMFEPSNDAVWTTGIVDVKPLTEGRLRRGSHVQRTSKFLGRKFDYVYEVVDADESSFVEMRVNEPFPMHIRYELGDAAGGTRASIHAKGDAGGFYRLAAPLLNRMVRRSIMSDLEMLKEYLEASSSS